MTSSKLIFFILSIFFLACSSKEIDYKSIKSFDEQLKNLNAVIEIPAGTNEKIEYRPIRNTFEIDSFQGKPRIIKFLPYPVNYGFIPSTVVNKDNNTDALDVMVLGKPLKTGQVILVRPLAILRMNDDGEADHKILSIPVDSTNQIINIKDFQDLSQNQTALRDLISDWFLNYDPNADIQILGWFDEGVAIEEVKASQI